MASLGYEVSDTDILMRSHACHCDDAITDDDYVAML